MLRSLTSTLSKKCVQQQLRQRLLSSIYKQTVAMSSSSGSPDNPQNLPHLPVPDLEKTFERYLQSVKPLVTSEELCTTEKVIEDFIDPSGGDACKLQQFLLDRAKCTTNWLEEWWLNTAYLGFRMPVTVYSSPGQALPFEVFNDETDRLCYAAKLIQAAGSYKMLIDSKKIPVEKMGKAELDMNQYNKIFGTSRIPGFPIDDIEYHGKSKHIVVVHNNHYFKVKLFEHHQLISEQQIFKHLNEIIQLSQKRAAPVGILSGDNRDNWAEAYKHLIKNPCNKESAREIQKCLFLVCLDGPMSHSKDSRQTAGGKQLIHGGGSCYNAGNRWFDKTVQFVIGCDGIVGLTYEHSPSEGQPIAVMVDYLVNFMAKNGGKDIADVGQISKPKQLFFDVDDQTECHIKTASKTVDDLVKNLELSCFTFDGFGKDFIKSKKFSPDSFIQMALQFTFYRLHGKPGAHYESAATRQFVGGRTETIRSCSCESVAFAKKMLDSGVSNADKAKAMKAAIDGHKKYTVAALNGLGVDRHLLGLKLAAQELGLPLPRIFKDPSYTRSTHMRVSSSQVATKCNGFMCYGPLVEDGYGCCYNPRDKDMNFAVSAFASCPETSAAKYHEALENSLCDMQKVLTTAKL